LHFAAFNGALKPSRKVPSPLQKGHFFVAKSIVIGGPEDMLGSLILLAFSWAKIRNLPVSFRVVPLSTSSVPVFTGLCAPRRNPELNSWTALKNAQLLISPGHRRKIGFDQHPSYPGKADKCLSRLFGWHLPGDRGVAAPHRAAVYRSSTGFRPLIQEYQRLPHRVDVVYHVTGLNLHGGKESPTGHLLPPVNCKRLIQHPMMRLFRLWLSDVI
jgi:hypothetical protein